MLFWGSIILLVIGIAFVAIEFFYETYFDQWGSGTLSTIAVACTISGLIALVCAVFVLAINYFGYKATYQTNIETYKALTYKVQSGACRDQFGLLSKDVLDEIQNWNEEITHYKVMENNFWVGIFYPDVYGDLGTIDYELYK